MPWRFVEHRHLGGMLNAATVKRAGTNVLHIIHAETDIVRSARQAIGSGGYWQEKMIYLTVHIFMLFSHFRKK